MIEMALDKREFLKTRVSWGVILRADLESIEEIKRLISTVPDITIAYQLTDIGRLRIIRENEGGRRE